MIFALAFALLWISLLSASGSVLLDEGVIAINEGLLEDESATAANDAVGALRSVADSITLADRLSPAANTHEESPKNSFVSYALDYFPPADPAASWARQAGSINADLLAASPDHVALQNTLWDAWTLGVAFSLTSAPKYQQQGVSLLSTTFEGDQALLPNMQYSLMIPDTSMEDARMNPLGFYEMNDVGLALDAATLLNISPPTASGFNQWMWRYATWLDDQLNDTLENLKPIDRLWFHTQQAMIFKHLGTRVKREDQCGKLRALFPLLVGEEGQFLSLMPAATPEVAQLETLHGLVSAAAACVGSGEDLWGLSATGTPSGEYIRRAASTVISATERQQVDLLPFSSGTSAARRISLGLALLYAETGREGVSELMLRLLAANPALQGSQIPLVAALAYVSGDDVDGAGELRWGGYRQSGLTCDELEEIGLPCAAAAAGFDWGGAGGVVVALVLALLALVTISMLFWWLRRRSSSARNGHELAKSQEADNSMDEIFGVRKLEDAKLAEAALEMGKVKVDPYEPDGYDPNNVSKILGELTVGEQVIKAKELKHKLLGHDPREQELASPASDMHGELGPVASAMSGGHSMMSGRDRSHMHSSFMGGGASGMSAHSLMAGASAMSGARSAMWQAERTSSGNAVRKVGAMPHKHSSSSSRHGQHGHSAHHGHSPQAPGGQHGHSGQRGGSSHLGRPRGSSQRHQSGSSAPIVHRGDGRPTSGSRQRHRTHTLGAPMQQQQQRQHRRHAHSSRYPQQRSRSTKKGGAEGKALLELDQALNALQSAVKPTKKSSRKVRPADPRAAASRSGIPSRSRRSQAQPPSVAEAHAKVLSAIEQRLRAAAALLANASKPKARAKEVEKPKQEDESVPAVEILENDSGVLPISAADGCIEGPRTAKAEQSDGSSSAGELSFTLPAVQSEPEDAREKLQLAGFQWLYTSDNKQSAEALQESIAVVQRQIKDNPEIVAQAAAAAMDPSKAGGEDGKAGGGEADAEYDAQKKNAYAVVAALVATVRAEAAAEVKRRGTEGYASSDDGEDELEGEESQLHVDGGSEDGSEAASNAASDVESDVGSVMEFASAAGDSMAFQREDLGAALDHVTLSPAHAPDSTLLSLHAGVTEEDERGEEPASSGDTSGASPV